MPKQSLKQRIKLQNLIEARRYINIEEIIQKYKTQIGDVSLADVLKQSSKTNKQLNKTLNIKFMNFLEEEPPDEEIDDQSRKNKCSKQETNLKKLMNQHISQQILKKVGPKRFKKHANSVPSSKTLVNIIIKEYICKFAQGRKDCNLYLQILKRKISKLQNKCILNILKYWLSKHLKNFQFRKKQAMQYCAKHMLRHLTNIQIRTFIADEFVGITNNVFMNRNICMNRKSNKYKENNHKQGQICHIIQKIQNVIHNLKNVYIDKNRIKRELILLYKQFEKAKIKQYNKTKVKLSQTLEYYNYSSEQDDSKTQEQQSNNGHNCEKSAENIFDCLNFE